jgi:hypothetical protein
MMLLINFCAMNLFRKRSTVRIINVDGKDTGVRENSEGAIFIDQEVFLKQKEVQEILRKVSEMHRRRYSRHTTPKQISKKIPPSSLPRFKEVI